ncbi:hypothetical protein LPJ53_005156 [Coemansia erecta]|uniref:Uncharacterized protein n=1 Tax=Coemansia erecta TaxID=147472 RepID=A0A9W7XWY2_9FUNG|nr:hypothetical protein LPJ53_005156 [Coemansia erecta]
MSAAAPPPAHYQYSPASKGDSANQQFYTPHSAAVPASTNEAYPGAPRRLPSVSELLISQEAAQQAAVAGHVSRDHAFLSMQQHKHSANATGAFGTASAYPAAESQMAYGIDVPVPRRVHDAATGDYVAAAYHRESESASSVSSHGTLVDGGAMLSNQQYHTFSKQHDRQMGHNGEYTENTGHIVASQNQQQQMVVLGMCEDDVFAAASILMSLRTCRMPC